MKLLLTFVIYSLIFGLLCPVSAKQLSSEKIVFASKDVLSPSWRMTPLGHPLGMNSFTQKVSCDYSSASANAVKSFTVTSG